MFTQTDMVDFATWLSSYSYDEYDDQKSYYDINGELYTTEEAFNLWYEVSGKAKQLVDELSVLAEHYRGWKIEYVKDNSRHTFTATHSIHGTEEINAHNEKEGYALLLERLNARLEE